MPAPFLTLRVHKLDLNPGLSGLCVGYEQGQWRAKQFSKHVFEWLPEFALSYNEREGLDSSNAIKMIRKAAQIVYTTEKFQKRGEFGELFLHIAVRQAFESIPAISKIFYKSANNDTVKGFDAVHVVDAKDGMELWLGEAKFYKDIKDAINDVVKELNDHFKTDYLRSEFTLISNKVEDSWPYAAELKKLLADEVSLDEVFKRICVPVLLTYDSKTITNHVACNRDYCNAFEQEINANYQIFTDKSLPDELRIHLFLLPLESKDRLIQILDEELKTWQSL